MTENYFRPGKFPTTDYTFCENNKCKYRNKCARSLERYSFSGELISVAYFDCDPYEVHLQLKTGVV